MAGNSEGAKKALKTKEKKYGTDFHARNGAVGGRARKRGYFGRLKDEGKTDELKALAKKAAAESNRVQGTNRKKSKRTPARVRGSQ